MHIIFIFLCRCSVLLVLVCIIVVTAAFLYLCITYQLKFNPHYQSHFVTFFVEISVAVILQSMQFYYLREVYVKSIKVI